MTDYCPVCRGEKRIRLPLTRELSAYSFEPETLPTAVESSWEEFDCPKCEPTLRIKAERYQAFKVKTFVEHSQMRPEQQAMWLDYAAKHLGRMIAEKILDDKMVEITQLEPDAFHGPGIQASLYIAKPEFWEPIEKRIAERQMEVADEVAVEAARLIDNWGSYFGWDMIKKSDACREVNDAVKRVKKARGK